MNIQFKKGVLEMCVLSLLDRKDRYGYELAHKISENIAISEGTIYPLLRRLKKEGQLATYLQESQEGPPRKYYKLTSTGKQTKNELKKEWAEFAQGVDNILKEDEHND